MHADLSKDQTGKSPVACLPKPAAPSLPPYLDIVLLTKCIPCAGVGQGPAVSVIPDGWINDTLPPSLATRSARVRAVMSATYVPLYSSRSSTTFTSIT